jgi:hypothetical protein
LRHALLLFRPRLGKGRAGPRLLPVHDRHRDLPEITGLARHIRKRPAGPHPSGNRQPLSRPDPYRGKRNEPAYTAFTAKTGAQLFGLSDAAFAAATTANFDRLFTRANAKAQAA